MVLIFRKGVELAHHKRRWGCAGWLLPVLILMLSLRTHAQLEYVTNFTYITNSDVITTNGAITVTGYKGLVFNLTIPATTNGYPVVCIATNALSGLNFLTNAVVPNSITNIEL